MNDAESAAAALEIMSVWNWEGVYRDFTGNFVSGTISLSLSEAVNKLAFDGHPDAAGAMLSLLADGRCTANGTYQWRAYRSESYQNEETGHIPVRHWQALQERLALPRGNDWSLPRVKFEVLDGFGSEKEYSAAEWAWRNNLFCTAQRSHSDFFHDGYFEEYFSAWNIEVYCPSAEIDLTKSDESSPVEDDNCSPAQASLPMIGHSGGRPPTYEWERAVAAIVFQWADEGSWQPASKTDVKNKLADWFAAKDQHPSDSLLKERARWLFDEFRRRSGEAENLAA